jgi:NADPH:quinone reductase-like Zn-dependent oxidoreductase
MKAVTYDRYGSFEELKISEIEKPIPKDDEVLISIKANSINKANLLLLQGKPAMIRLFYGLKGPKNKTPIGDFSGVIESVGKTVTSFKPGDEVFAESSSSGVFCEYAVLKANKVVLKPKILSHEASAAIPLAGQTALQALRDAGKLKSSQSVLIYGASGGVGTYAIQIAKAMGAHVTAVCSQRSHDQAYQSKADVILDYNKKDDLDRLGQYDLILGVNGYHPLRFYQKHLNRGGIYVCIGGDGRQIAQAMLQGPIRGLFTGLTFKSLVAKNNPEDTEILANMADQGQLHPIIDSVFPMEHVQKAYQHYASGKTLGKVIISNTPLDIKQ